MANGYLKPKLRGRSENFVSAARTLGVPQSLSLTCSEQSDAILRERGATAGGK